MASSKDIVNLLKACAKKKDLNIGRTVHAKVLKRGAFGKNIFVGSTLVNMYAKCGALTKAQQVFDELPVQDAVSWNVLLTGFAQHGRGEEALHCLECMECRGLFLDAMTFAGVLQACASIGAAQKGNEIHGEIVKKGWLCEDRVLGTALVDMYAKFGALAEAQLIFDQLPTRDVVSWNALMSGYVHHGHSNEALYFLELMKCDGLSPNAVTFSCILKACGIIGTVEKGIEIHNEVVRKGLHEKDSVLGTALVDMYAKCGALEMAQHVFDELPFHDVISWNVLSAGYCQHGQAEKALHCFEQMKGEGISPCEMTFAGALKACAILETVDKGNQVYAEILKEGWFKSQLLSNALVDMYVKCHALAKAQEVFDELLIRDVLSWNALITGYVQHGHNVEACKFFEQMQRVGLSPDAVTFLAVVKACGSIEKGKELHAEVVRMGFLGEDGVLESALVDMYASWGMLAMAQQVFEELPFKDVVSWTGLIAGYAEHYQGEEALSCLERMQGEGILPNAVTFACVLKACGSIMAIQKGKEIHAGISSQGSLERNIVLGNALVDMYAKCSVFAAARRSFDELTNRDVVSWNALLSGYAQSGRHEMVMSLFKDMTEECTEPSLVTFHIVLKACKFLHLVNEAQMCFKAMKASGINPSLEHYICMVHILGHAGEFNKVMEVIKEMSLSDDPLVWFTLLGACQRWGNVKLGKLAFNHAVRLDENHVFSYVRMSNIYAAAGMQEDADKTFAVAKQVFEKLQVRDSASWNALVVGFCEHGHGKEAFDCFERMQHEGLCPDVETFMCILRACGSIGAVEKGMEVHNEIIRSGLLGTTHVLGNAIVDMYSKCGALLKAQQVFDDLPDRDLVCWTALIRGLAQHGHGQRGLHYFEQMMGEGFSPDAVSFACILRVCGCLGAVEKGQIYFDRMRTHHGITPILEHYNSMVDLLGRAGHFDKAITLIKQMPSDDNLPAWFTLLSACRKWGNGELGRSVFENVVCADQRATFAYTCNIYAGAGMQENAK